MMIECPKCKKETQLVEIDSSCLECGTVICVYEDQLVTQRFFNILRIYHFFPFALIILFLIIMAIFTVFFKNNDHLNELVPNVLMFLVSLYIMLKIGIEWKLERASVFIKVLQGFYFEKQENPFAFYAIHLINVIIAAFLIYIAIIFT
jgi:hypothetical protein